MGRSPLVISPVLSLVLLLASAPAFAAAILPLSQERSVFASAEASSPDDFDADFSEEGAPDFAPFAQSVGQSASVPGVSGSSVATQASLIEADEVRGDGTAGASGTALGLAVDGAFAGESFFDLVFEATLGGSFQLSGALQSAAASADGFASLLLEQLSPGGDQELFSREVGQGDALTFSEMLALEAGGTFRLTAFALAVALPDSLLPTAAGSSSFSFHLLSLPEPAIAPLLLGAALAFWAFARGRSGRSMGA